MRNTGLEEAQDGIKIAGRNINNLRYADDITLMVESEEELPHIQGQGQQLRVPGCDCAGAAERSYPPPEAGGGGWEKLPPA